MGASWTVIGAGSILPREGYGSSGHALRADFGAPVTLFDCGPGTIRSLAAAGIGLEEVERVVLTHFHADHMLDLFALAFARRNPAFAAPPLELIGPVGLGKRLSGVADVLGGSTRFEGTELIEVEPGEEPQSMERDGITLSWVRTQHTAASLAWRADVGPTSVTYTGDTCEVPEVVELAQGSHLFVCECSFADEHAIPTHLTPSSAARMARDAYVHCLLLTHFYPGLDPLEARAVAARTFEGSIEIAHDGSVHAF